MTELKKELLDATTEAYAGSLFVRALLENQSIIEKAEKLKINHLEEIIDKLMILETEKYQVLLSLLSKGSASLSDLVNELNLPELTIMKHILSLQNEGWVDLLDKDNLVYGIKLLVTGNEEKLELDLAASWNLKSAYDPIKIIADAHLCCLCGACKAVCPVEAITIADDRPNIDEEKCIHCGLCNYHCPRTLMPLNLLRTYVSGPQAGFFENVNTQPFGPHRIIKSAQTMNEKIKTVCQDGGMVTTYLQYLFDKNEIDGAIVVKRKPDSWDTQAIIVKSADELLETAGTKYAVSPNWEALNKARELGCRHLAFVGTPCQVQAMRKYQVYSNIFEGIWGSIDYIIGIFCMETFAYPDIIKISEEICQTPLSEAAKMNINKGKFFVTSINQNIAEVPIKEVTGFARHACHYCLDLTNELADISCGSIGSGNGWSTIVVRSEKGEKLFNAALEENYFQINDIPEDQPFGIPLIQKLASGKKTRNFSGLLQHLEGLPPYYYNSLKDIMKVEE
jgi:coenzyme F420 hydrogenase subunit beta